MKGLLIIAALLISLTGYAGSYFGHNANWWNKPETNLEQVNKDYSECKLYGMGHCEANPFIAMEITKDCMINKGYRK